MSTAAAIIPTLEGLVGNALKVQGTDTANDVTQFGQRWLDAMKKEVRHPDANPAEVWFVEGLTVNGLNTPSANWTAGAQLFGLIGRNNDVGTRYLQAFYNNNASGGFTTGALQNRAALVRFFSLAMLTASAANNPTYVFAVWPGGVDYTAPGTPTVASPNFASTVGITGTTNATDNTVYLVYRQ